MKVKKCSYSIAVFYDEDNKQLIIKKNDIIKISGEQKESYQFAKEFNLIGRIVKIDDNIIELDISEQYQAMAIKNIDISDITEIEILAS